MKTPRKNKRRKANSVIRFVPEKRYLEKARIYIDNLERFIQDRDRAIPILLRALHFGDQKLKHEITSLLGGFAGSDIIGHLYRIIKDTAEDGDLRHEAAVQLSVTLPMADDRRPLVDSLLEDLNSTEAELRSYAALALGWEGNHPAVDALIERLDDQDEFVQQSVVNALSNLREDRVYHQLLARLKHGRLELQRAILFALVRFDSRHEEIAEVYKQQMDGADEELRFDAFELLGRVTDTGKQIPFYRHCLEDRDPRVREKTLARLAELGSGDLNKLKPEIESMLSDPQVRVKQAAIRVLRRIGTPDE